MLLLDIWSGQFVLKDPRDLKTKYAILSHTWDSAGEQTYQELREIQKRYPLERQPRQGPGEACAENDPPSLAERPKNLSFCTPLTTSPGHDTLMNALSVMQRSSASAPSRSQCLPTQPTTATPAVPPTPSVPQRRPDSERTLSPMWGDSGLSPKIRDACKVARKNGHDYIWIDSCCIDKMSSAELSEAINSMYQWYNHAVVCYAFLADVSAEKDHKVKDSCFRWSWWFTRGWTLQELIAPVDVRFLSEDWTFIKSKHALADLVTEITGINRNALLRVKPLKEFSVTQRLSWAAKRETMRVEDWAYSLLGIFDINMPTLYGEGHHAFRQLQEEIL